MKKFITEFAWPLIWISSWIVAVGLVSCVLTNTSPLNFVNNIPLLEKLFK
jgi:uncharacterized membrane protein